MSRPSFLALFLQTVAKRFHLPQFLHCLPYAGQSFPVVWNQVTSAVVLNTFECEIVVQLTSKTVVLIQV